METPISIDFAKQQALIRRLDEMLDLCVQLDRCWSECAAVMEEAFPEQLAA